MRIAPRLPSRTALRARAHLIAAVALGCMACLLVHAALTESPTYDEPSHVVRGLAYLSSGDARLSFGHPPLGNLVQGIPGWLLDRPLDFRSLPGWDTWDVGRIARTLMSRDYERVRTAIVGGRMMTALLTVVLGAYLYRFCLRWGRLRAALTVCLYACFPLFLAHGHLATTDMPLTVATTVAIGEFVRWLEGRSWIRFLTFSVAAGAAFATKFNGLFLVPVLGLAGLVVALRGGGPFAQPALRARLMRLGAFVALATAVAVLVVNAAYRFQRTGWPVERILARDEPHNWLTVPFDDELMEELSLLPSLPARMPIPLPYPWVFGLHTIKAQDERGHGGWFFGEQRTSALYFPVLSVIKTPAAVLSLLLVGAVVVLRRRRLPRPATLALWIAPALLLGVSLFSEIQIGVRHLLPIFPPLVIGAGWAATLLGAVAQIPVAVVLVAAAAETLSSAPAYIGHFSWAIGGSRPGHRISIIAEDWGQDVRRLATFVKERRLRPLYYLPYGSAAPMEMKRFGASFRRFDCSTRVRGPAWIAVHAAHAVRFKKPCGPVSLDREPDLVIAEHVWLYRIEPPEGQDEPAPVSEAQAREVARAAEEAQAGEGARGAGEAQTAGAPQAAKDARAAGEVPADPSVGPAP